MLTERQRDYHIGVDGGSCPKCNSLRITIGPVVEGDPRYRLCNCQDCYRAWRDLLDPEGRVIDVQEL
jgi:transposase-like protein